MWGPDDQETQCPRPEILLNQRSWSLPGSSLSPHMILHIQTGMSAVPGGLNSLPSSGQVGCEWGAGSRGRTQSRQPSGGPLLTPSFQGQGCSRQASLHRKTRVIKNKTKQNNTKQLLLFSGPMECLEDKYRDSSGLLHPFLCLLPTRLSSSIQNKNHADLSLQQLCPRAI